MQQLTKKTKMLGWGTMSFYVRCVFRPAGLSDWHVRQLPQCPGGRPPPEGCRRHGPGMVSVKDEPGVWPCSCAAQWRVRSGKPQSGNTFPLSPGCKMMCNCPGDGGHTGKCRSECEKQISMECFVFWICGSFWVFSDSASIRWLRILLYFTNPNCTMPIFVHLPSSWSRPRPPPPRCADRQRQKKSMETAASSVIWNKSKQSFSLMETP